MAKRPQVSEELVEFVQEMHEDVTGSRASSFQQALQTFHSLHHAAAHMETEEAVAGSLGPAAGPPAPRARPHVDPDEQAVFKTHLDDDGRLAVPEGELSAFGFETGDLLQVIAYPVPENGSERDR